jgi:hypothetical protein
MSDVKINGLAFFDPDFCDSLAAPAGYIKGGFGTSGDTVGIFTSAEAIIFEIIESQMANFTTVLEQVPKEDWAGVLDISMLPEVEWTSANITSGDHDHVAGWGPEGAALTLSYATLAGKIQPYLDIEELLGEMEGPLSTAISAVFELSVPAYVDPLVAAVQADVDANEAAAIAAIAAVQADVDANEAAAVAAIAAVQADVDANEAAATAAIAAVSASAGAAIAALASAVTVTVGPALRMPVISGGGIDWMEIGDASPGNQGLTSNLIIHSLHFQEGAEEVYDGMSLYGKASSSGTSFAMGLYAAGTEGRPAVHLWAGPSTSISTTNAERFVLFSAGTWTTAGLAYKDGSGNFVCPRGMMVYKAIQHSGICTWATVSQCRSIGRPMAGNAKPYTGFKEVVTYGTWPANATPVVISTDIPTFPLRPL